MDIRFSYLLAILACGIYCQNVPLRLAEADIDRIFTSSGSSTKGPQVLLSDETKTVNFYKLPKGAFVAVVEAKESHSFNSIHLPNVDLLLAADGCVTEKVTWEYWRLTNYIYFDTVCADKAVRLVVHKKNGELWKKISWEEFFQMEYRYKPSVILHFKQDPEVDGIIYKEKPEKPHNYSITLIESFVMVKKIIKGNDMVFMADAKKGQRIIGVFSSSTNRDYARIKTLDKDGTVGFHDRKQYSHGWRSLYNPTDQAVLLKTLKKVSKKYEKSAAEFIPVETKTPKTGSSTESTPKRSTSESASGLGATENTPTDTVYGNASVVTTPEETKETEKIADQSLVHAIQFLKLSEYKDLKTTFEKLRSDTWIKRVENEDALYNELEIYGEPYIKSSHCARIKTLYVDKFYDSTAIVAICEDKEKKLHRFYVMLRSCFPYVTQEKVYVQAVLKERGATNIYTPAAHTNFGIRVYEEKDEVGKFTAIEPQTYVVTGMIVDVGFSTVYNMKDISPVALLRRVKIYRQPLPWHCILEYSDNGAEKNLYLKKFQEEWVVMTLDEIKQWIPNVILDESALSHLHEPKENSETPTLKDATTDAAAKSEDAVPSTKTEVKEDSESGNLEVRNMFEALLNLGDAKSEDSGDAKSPLQTPSPPINESSGTKCEEPSNEPENALVPDKTYEALAVVSDELEKTDFPSISSSYWSKTADEEDVKDPSETPEALRVVATPQNCSIAPSRQNSFSEYDCTEPAASGVMAASVEDLLSIEKTPSIRGGNVQEENIPIDETPKHFGNEYESYEENGFTVAGISTSIIVGSLAILVASL